MAGIYIHIPFCKQACHYCDFHFSTQTDYRQNLVNALHRELQLQKLYLENKVVKSIYFGGGTPSLLTAHEISDLIATCYRNFNFDTEPEITIEANPDDLSLTYLTALKDVGVNRLSIGIQTFSNEALVQLNRAHNKQRALASIEEARNAGFTNISLDLMYALPGQTQEQWMADISQALAFKPEHISAYTLTIEPQTAFGKWHNKGKLQVPDEDTAAHFFQTLSYTLVQNGYEHYEVSNFCLPECYSKHNSSYWLQKHYLGIGPSAHSYNGVSRQYNIANNHQYMKAIGEGVIPATHELLTDKEKINDILLTGLRTKWGVSLHELINNFKYDILSIHQQKIRFLTDNQLVLINNNQLILTKEGLIMADKIASDLFI
jgi:oxygen-independent coproporphyrinogen-3 oxidase